MRRREIVYVLSDFQVLHGTCGDPEEFKAVDSPGPIGLQITGSVNIRREAEKLVVEYDLKYQFNDVTNPNFKYQGENIRVRLANFAANLALEDPEDYATHISWQAKSKLIYTWNEELGRWLRPGDSDLDAESAEGWPFLPLCDSTKPKDYAGDFRKRKQ